MNLQPVRRFERDRLRLDELIVRKVTRQNLPRERLRAFAVDAHERRQERIKRRCVQESDLLAAIDNHRSHLDGVFAGGDPLRLTAFRINAPEVTMIDVALV